MDKVKNCANNAAMRGIILTLIGGSCWGFSGTCSQYIMLNYNIDPIWLTAVRMIFAGIILVTISLTKNREKLCAMVKDRKSLLMLMVFGVFGLLLSQITYLKTISYSNSGTATILQYTGPVLILIYTCLKLKRMPTKKEFLAIIMTLIGTFLIATHGNPSEMALSPKVLFWGIGSAFTLVFYTLLPVKLMAKWGNLNVLGAAMLFGGAILFFAAGIWNYHVEISLQLIIALIVITAVGTVMAYSFYLEGVCCLGSVKASMIACVEPVVATLLSAVWLHAKFTMIDLIGFAAVLSTVFILAKKEKKEV